jgi:hypothetical protein
MPEREGVEQLIVDIRRRRQDAEAEAGHAPESMVRLVGGMTPLSQVDLEQVRAASETFCGAVSRLRALQEFARELRSLLM